MIAGMPPIAILCSDREKSLPSYNALGFSLCESHIRPERPDEILMVSGYGMLLELFVSSDHPPRVTSPENGCPS